MNVWRLYLLCDLYRVVECFISFVVIFVYVWIIVVLCDLCLLKVFVEDCWKWIFMWEKERRNYLMFIFGIINLVNSGFYFLWC